MHQNNIISGSFRDPSGFVFRDEKGLIHRQINKCYQENYNFLMSSGLYSALVKDELLIKHSESATNPLDIAGYKIILPEQVPFISYPYEWCFSQLKDAATVTLKIAQRALSFNMMLKDASAYNIQFVQGKPVLIDTLSFEKYKEGDLWKAYRQFCQHFLAPLSLMSYRHSSMNRLMELFIDGIPLEIASALLPWKTKLKISLLSHLHFHAKKTKNTDTPLSGNRALKGLSKFRLQALLDNLMTGISGLKWEPDDSVWNNYYETKNNYTEKAFEAKKNIIEEVISITNPTSVWDLGSNTGIFSRIPAKKNIFTVSADFDTSCVEINYRQCKENKERSHLPLVLDLNNPSPSIGWMNKERNSFAERGPADLLLALALIHHLAIANNVPMKQIARFFSGITKFLAIEFVPKEDSKVQVLLSSREDIFADYTEEKFQSSFLEFFKLVKVFNTEETSRKIFLFEKKAGIGYKV
ncbi:MAG: hypothetical protein A3G23_01455 [Bacteroidetes bacterium RIFCSPLOWO2_12_FULL_37_12]|nr:MAG: hypothetical protein A3G23_01455 [Bacteroidetes bacterium RIFCSPLOWO2_12_FULL_37_12]